MDNKTIFVKTSKGESEMQGKSSHLPDHLKRALLMVDGTSTFSEISKRAAPSMRASLGETFEELEKTGFIQDKDKIGKTPKIAVPPKMSVPGKMAKPHKQEPVAEEAGELDFLTGFPVTPPEKPAIVPDNAKSLMAQAEERSRQHIEAEEIKAEKIKVQKEAEATRRNAEQEAARIREETVRRAKEEAESTRLKAEQEARRLREAAQAPKLDTGKDASQLLEDAIKAQQQEAEAKRLQAQQQAKKGHEEIESAKLKSEQDAKQHLEASIREQQLAAEAARLLAEQQVRKEREELEAARMKIEQESRMRLEAAARERERAEAARIKAEQEAAQILIEMEMAKLKAEQEAKARIEAEARELARIKAEEEAAARQAAELLARQEREAAAREAAARAAEAREAAARAAEAREAAARAAKAIEEPPAAESAGFAFDQFQIEEPQNLAEPSKDRSPGQKAGSKDTFAFDSFQLHEPQHPAEPKARQPAQKSGAASEMARSKLDQEQKQREEEQRIAAEAQAREIAEAEAKAKEEAEAQAREIADAQAREIAEAQAKVWAEAEQRALEAAKANAALAAHQADYSSADTSRVEKPVRVARVRREPFAWGKLVGFFFKLGLFLLVLLAAVLFIVPYVLPTRDYMPKVQQLLSARLHQPVHLGNLSGRILPMPRLDLGEIYIGDAKQFQAVDAQINFDLMGLFTDAKPISSVVFHGVKVRGPWVRNVAEWLQQLASDNQYPVSRMVISNGTLDADAFQLTGVEGNLDFTPAGKFTQADLRADSGKFSMDLIPAPGNKFQATITVRNGALPLLPNWSFDELVAKGELSNDELLIKSFDARILGGTVQGDATISWRSGWRAQGALSAKAIIMENISKLLDGKIEGSARFKMASMDLAGLADSAALDGSFNASDGLISGMDIVETARMRSKEHLPGGRTRYEKLGGDISYANDTYHFKQVKIDAGVMDATATFDVTKQQLSGKMNVKLSIQDRVAPVVLQMGGAIDNPTLRYAP